jgi:DNA anti-recombination protein RmuC
MTGLRELCKELDTDFEAALSGSRQMRAELEAFVESGERALASLVGDAEAALATIEEWQHLPGTLARPDVVLADIPERTQALSLQLSTLLPLLLEAAAADAFVEQRASLSSAREHVDKVGTDLVARIAEMRDATDAVLDELENLAKGSAQRIATVDEAIGTWVEQVQQSMSAMTSNVSDRLAGVTDEVDSASEQLREGLMESFLQSASDQIGGEAQRLHGAVDGLGQQAVERVGELRNGVGAVTEQLQAILDLIEPVKPILDQAAAVA